ncbi:sigma-70 family RNA polymerase sigma factor [Neobacillus sp. SCS-31]|uniref:sigma-70 family RNA polymerase sigma factor n=1 Tax=Neobacillus oceani TaxID=3115292 RepID=UPI0039057F8F
MIAKVNEESRSEAHLNSLNREERLIWLMNAYGNDVIKLAYTYLKQKHLAEDVAQDVFIKCYEKLNAFRNESTYKTWLIRITVNRCNDVLKSWSFKNLYFTNFFTPKQDNISEQTLREDENEFISIQVLKLPLKLREVIILFYYQEFSIEEISEMLKINKNTVKTRLHRGRQKLREGYEKGWKINER